MTTKEELIENLTKIFEKAMEQMGELINQYAENIKTNETIEPEQSGLWKPKEGERYYFINYVGSIEGATNCTSFTDYRISIGNCYKTREDAEKALEHKKIETQLRDIAARLNKGTKIDYKQKEQKKYYLALEEGEMGLRLTYPNDTKIQGTIYCLDPQFKDVAIQKIGEDRLKEYLKE